MVIIYVFDEAERSGRERRVRAALRKRYGDRADQYILTKEEKGRPVLREISGGGISSETIPEEKVPIPRTLYERLADDKISAELDSVSVTDSDSWWLMAFADVPVGIDLQRCSLRRSKQHSLRRNEQRTDCPPEFSYWNAEGDVAAGGERRGTPQLSEEEIRRYVHLARRFFHPDEIRYVLGDRYASGEKNGSCQVRQRFFQVWTAKEAYVKFTGTGIDGNFSGFSVAGNLPGNGGSYPRLLPDVQFVYPAFREGYMLCICVPADAEETVKLVPVDSNAI